MYYLVKYSMENQFKQLKLNEAAMLLMQVDKDDLSDLLKIKEALIEILNDLALPEASRVLIFKVEEKIESVIADNRLYTDSILMELGDLIQKAMNSLEKKTDMGNEDIRIDPEQSKETDSEKELIDYMPDDVDAELFAEFITECTDLIVNAEEALLLLENDPEDMDAVATVFRAFHTVKGTSAFMELYLLADMGHHAETLLSRVRDGEIRYVGGYADLALRSIDMIKELIQGVEKALSGEPLTKPDGYDQLFQILKDPEKNGISDKADADDFPEIEDILVAQGKVSVEDVRNAESPRLGDILVARGQADREEIEMVAKKYGTNKLIGSMIVECGTASVTDVGQALRSQTRKKNKKTIEASVRVSTERLDRLVDMVGELVIAHAMVAEDKIIIQPEHHELLKKVVHSSKIVRELQDISMSMRMIPLKSTFQNMVRLVRDVSHKLGKKVTLVTAGEDTEIDRNMADAIKDPLVHMVRNAVGHGIEMPDVRRNLGKNEVGIVKLSAYHSAGSVIVEINDDGKGIDRDAILEKAIEKKIISDGSSLSDKEIFNLIFEPGFSTATDITDVSGRGVGMDVVKKNIEAICGTAEIHSEKGKGSVFQMKLPLTLAIIDGMVARVGSEIYVIPTSSIVTSLRPESKNISKVMNKGEMLSIHGDLIPLFSVASLFDVERDSDITEESLVVIIENEENSVGLIIDELVGRQQVVVKTLGESVQNITGISGGAIMPNGRVGLILDVGGMIKLSNLSMN
jgi:two-component system chemotaxis sensor kinase CheA